jgi:hypothetical protein
VVNLPERTDRRDGMALAAALSDIELDFIDAVRGVRVLDKALPPLPKGSHRISDANVGSWRGHMNAIREFVQARSVGSNISGANQFKEWFEGT